MITTSENYNSDKSDIRFLKLDNDCSIPSVHFTVMSSSSDSSEKPSSSEDTGSDSGNASTSESQSHSSDHNQGQASGQNPSDAFSGVFTFMKSNPILWQQFSLLAAQFGMSPELFEKYLGLVVKSVCENPQLKAQISAQAGEAAQSNPQVVDQLLAVAAMQQAMNPILIAQFVAQNSGGQGGVLGSKKDESSESSSSEEVDPVPSWRSIIDAAPKRLEEIWMVEVPYHGDDSVDSKSRDLIRIYELRRENFKYFDRCGELNLSDEELINIGCQTKHFLKKKLEMPNLEEMQKNRKAHVYSPTKLGIFRRSLNKFVQAHGTHVNRIVLPPSTEEKPIYGRIELHRIHETLKKYKELYLEGHDTVLSGKGRFPIFTTGLATMRVYERVPCDAFMYVSGVRFLSPPFTDQRDLRSQWDYRSMAYGPAQFINCTFDAPLTIQQDVWLFDCKGKELRILDDLAARCIRCDFEKVVVMGGYIIAKECHFGKLLLGEGTAHRNPLQEKFRASDLSHFCLDRCVVDEADTFHDDQSRKGKIMGISECSRDSVEVFKRLEDMWKERGWVQSTQIPQRYILRTVMVCDRCQWQDHPMCFFCQCPLLGRNYTQAKPFSVCQFCMADYAAEQEFWASARHCARCWDMKAELTAHCRLCAKCGENYNPHRCYRCGARHGQRVVFSREKE